MNDIDQRVRMLEEQLAALTATKDIERTLSNYAVAVDEKQPGLLASLFTEDAVLTIPEWGIEARGHAAIMEFYAFYWNKYDHPRRYFSHSNISLHAAEATAFMYWHVTQEHAGESILGWGTYDWTFRHDAKRWLISKLNINILAMTALQAGWAGSSRLSRSK